MTNKQISVLGSPVELVKRTANRLTGINVGEKLSYDFYDGLFRDTDMLFVKPKSGNPTPRKCALVAERLSKMFGLPVVFVLSPAPTYERQRLLDKDVYFIMSDRYANLPMLVAVEKVAVGKLPERLTPVAQYMLLYHLEIENIDGKSTKAIASLMPYSYESVSVGLTCLADLGLCNKVPLGARGNVIRFKSSGKQLWEDAGKFLFDPVKKRLYCDGLSTDREFPICGINALAHYSMLNPDAEKWAMMTVKEYQEATQAGLVINPNQYDGGVVIEVWKYPAVSRKGNPARWIDPLSLALSLRKDEDPRVEEATEQIINNFKW